MYLKHGVFVFFCTSRSFRTRVDVPDGKSWTSLLGELLGFVGKVPPGRRVQQAEKWRASSLWQKCSVELRGPEEAC